MEAEQNSRHSYKFSLITATCFSFHLHQEKFNIEKTKIHIWDNDNKSKQRPSKIYVCTRLTNKEIKTHEIMLRLFECQIVVVAKS
jgi:hypothetical protein